MALIQGLAAHAAGAELLPFRYDPGDLGLQEVEIGITHCGICHSDLHLISNDWGISQYPFIRSNAAPRHRLDHMSAQRLKERRAALRHHEALHVLVGNLGHESSLAGCRHGLSNTAP